MSNDLIEEGASVATPAAPPSSESSDTAPPAESNDDWKGYGEWTKPDDPIVQNMIKAKEAKLKSQEPPPKERPVRETIKEMSLAELAEYSDPTDYANERKDQELLKNNDPRYNEPHRQQEREERQQRLAEHMTEKQAKLDRAQGIDREAIEANKATVEARIRHERANAQGLARIELYEQQNPGFVEFMAETGRTYGDITQDVGTAIFESHRCPEILDRICQYPESIAELNQLSERELDKFIAHMEGQLDAGQPARQATPGSQLPTLAEIQAKHGKQYTSVTKPKLVSTAPKPVSKVSGKAHAHAKSPENMGYDEYRAWRERGGGGKAY